MDIYSVLSSKSHNPHYLNKYIRFVKNCQIKNRNYQGYTENHHICPKANDMFPEYVSFKDYPWNCVVLTARQHFIAHMLLWKTYRNKSMTMSFNMMKNLKEYKVNSKIYEKLKIERSFFMTENNSRINIGKVNIKEGNSIRKIELEEFHKGQYKAQHANTVMVTDGQSSFRVDADDPRLLTGELAGHTKGMTYAVDNNGDTHYISKNDPRFLTGELKGNNAGTITITNGKRNKRVDPSSEIPKGWYRGMTKPSPKNSIWINNGEISKMFKGDKIPEGWVKGRIFKNSKTS